MSLDMRSIPPRATKADKAAKGSADMSILKIFKGCTEAKIIPPPYA
jgi:hypothetical protein